MPLSKQRNKERMRQVRLHKRLSVKPVQPKVIRPGLDADGNVMPDYD
jgi:hypothetical protein